MSSMTPQQRVSDLLEIVGRRGTASIAELSAELGVSAATVRRDLAALAEQRLLLRTHGGAAALGGAYELPLQYKVARQADAKIAIARAAAGLVEPGQTIGLNGGTTTTELARELGRSDRFLRDDGGFGITIVTNALNIGYELSVRAHVRTVVTGGVARHQSYELVGALSRTALDNFVLDLAVLGVDGLNREFGATTTHDGEAEVSRRFVAVARRVIVVADATKLERSTFARICPLDRIDVLVTDQAVTEAFAADLAAAGTELIVADGADGA